MIAELSSVDAWRLFNVFLAVVALALGAYRLKTSWRFWSASQRLAVMALLLFALATVYGSAEQIAQGTPFGFRIMLGTVANIWAVMAFGIHSERE